MSDASPRFRTGRAIDPATIIEDLGDGLVLRHATSDDAEPLAAFNGETHTMNPGADDPDDFCSAWTSKLLLEPHPTLQPRDFTIVEDTSDGTIVSSLNLISQTWSYGGVPFDVGRPELVATHPDYRRRGLVRKQFDVIHRWSAERDQLMQGITGIPNYYRQFGYEMTLDLDAFRVVMLSSVAPTDASAEAELVVRPATDLDIATLIELDRQGGQRSLVTCLRDEALWQYEMSRSGDPACIALTVMVVEDRTGSRSVGSERPRIVSSFVYAPDLTGHAQQPANIGLPVYAWEVAPGVPWSSIGPVVLRYLTGRARSIAKANATVARHSSGAPEAELPDRIILFLGNEHPAYTGLPQVLQPDPRGYSWFIRIPDLPRFLWHVRAVLESRLRSSPFSGYSGELTIGSHKRGPTARLVFDQGQLSESGPWQGSDRPSAIFPELTFLHLVMGWRSLDDLRYLMPDVSTRSTSDWQLVSHLFPKQPSHVWPVW